uniref:Carboxypeptidase n=1 Tax=Arion vulgaris TaxID=1028688 RepID=A0A0B7B8G6_9EUPU
MLKGLLIFFLVSWARDGLAAPKEDLITDLPGLSWEPNFKQYSGYLQGAGTKKLHYWFVESSSQPRTDPVVLWMNGGPGCSSLDGFLTEHGPFRVNDDGKNLEANPYSWNLITNMIYLESPAGVGFSYSDDRNYTTDDDDVARNNHLALQDFFQKFPEYKENEFYITGESYAGIYAPTLVSVVLDDPDINLKGFAVGNGLSDNDMNDNSIVYFTYYHGLIETRDWFRMRHACCPGNETEMWCDFIGGSRKYKDCADENDKISNLVWSSGLNVYNLYSECAGGVSNHNLYFSAERGKFVTNNFGWPFMFLKNKVADLRMKLSMIPADKLLLTPACTNDTAIVNYLGSPNTRKALHIPDVVQPWEVCSYDVSTNYGKIYSTMAPQYQKAIDRKLRILVYNGDIDMACNFLGDEWFVDSLHVKNPQVRKPWFYKAADGTKQIAGYVKNFDRVSFVTIRGAGHMVPTDQPIQALKMYVNFIQDLPF